MARRILNVALALLGGLSAAGAAEAASGWDACAKAPNRACVVDEFLRNVESTHDSSRAAALAFVARVQAEAGMTSAATTTLRRAAEAGAPLQGKTRDPFLVQQAIALAELGKAAEARPIADSVGDRPAAIGAFLQIAKAERRLGVGDRGASTLAHAADVAASLDGTDATVWLDSVATAQGDAGLMTEASANFRRAVEIARKFSEQGDKVWRVAASLARLGQVDEAVSLAQSESGKPDPTSLEAIAVAVAKTGKLEEAWRMSGRIDNAASHIDALGVIAVEQRKAGHSTRFEGILAEAQTLAESAPEGEDRCEAFAALAQAQAQAGRAGPSRDSVAKAMEILGALTDANDRRFAASEIGPRLARMGAEAEAIKLARATRDDPLGGTILYLIGEALAEQGKFVEVASFADFHAQPATRANYLALLAMKLPK